MKARLTSYGALVHASRARPAAAGTPEFLSAARTMHRAALAPKTALARGSAFAGRGPLSQAVLPARVISLSFDGCDHRKRGRAFPGDGAPIQFSWMTARQVYLMPPKLSGANAAPFREFQDCGALPCRKRAGGIVPSPSLVGAQSLHDARGDIASELEAVFVAHVAASPEMSPTRLSRQGIPLRLQGNLALPSSSTAWSRSFRKCPKRQRKNFGILRGKMT